VVAPISRSWRTAAIASVLLVVVAACTTVQDRPAPTPVSVAPPPDYAALNHAVDEFVSTPSAAALRNIRAVLVSVDGEPVVTRYYGSGPAETGHVTSVTKSVLATLVGIAIDEGHLRLNQTLAELLPRYRSVMSARVASITLHQLVTMTSGIVDGGRGGATFSPSDKDPIRTILEHGSASEPGSRWVYANCSAHLVSAVLAEATGRSVLDYAREKLFQPLHIDTSDAYEGVEPLLDDWANAPPMFSPEFERADFAWATDRQGLHLGAALLKLTTPDMLKLGELYLYEGIWSGRQVISPEWVRAATTPVTTSAAAEPPPYGYLWWTFKLSNGRQAFAASGSYGNLVLVVPDFRLVLAVSSRPGGSHPIGSGLDALQPLVEYVILPPFE
jgi:CubicO group peptidase (beta-lactamase class C family)